MSYLGLLCLGKNDFDAIENFRGNAFFIRALGLANVPSSPTLRQRLDANAPDWFDLGASNESKAAGQPHQRQSPLTSEPWPVATPRSISIPSPWTMALPKKELVGRTYAGVDGYCPFAVYLGSLGYCLELALRPGVQHSAAESEYNFERALPMAASLVSGVLAAV